MPSLSLRRLAAVAVVLALAAPALALAAAADTTRVTVPIAEALVLGPFDLPLPAFHDAASRGAGLDDLLRGAGLDVAGRWPRAGDRVPRPDGAPAAWTRATAGDDAFVLAGAHDVAREAWLAVRLVAGRWQETTLAVTAPDSVRLAAWLDGAPVALAGSPPRAAELTLTPGTHVLILRTLAPAGLADPWRVAPALSLAPGLAATALRAAAAAPRAADIHLTLDAPRVASLAVSPDGEHVALRLSAHAPGGAREQWIEVRRARDGSLVATWPAADGVRDLQWVPTGAALSWVTEEDDRGDLWRYDLARGEAQRLLRAVERLGSYRWAPDGSYVIHEVRVEARADERKVKRVESPADRQPGWRDRTYLVQVGVPGGLARRLTAGPLSPERWEISPDGRRVLFFLGDQDLTARPYFSSRLHELDLATLAVTEVLADPWIEAAAYAPDGSARLLLRGSPSAFDNLGLALPAGTQPNDYGGQLYLFDRASGQARALTRELGPDVASFAWSRADGRIYALCIDGKFQRLYRREARDGAAWEPVPGGDDLVEEFDLALAAPVAATRGTGANQPSRAHVIDLKARRARLLAEPGAEAWRDVAFGRWESWAAALPGGETLDGHVYYPPDFDPARRYPLIVFYYGGTSPVGVEFGSRYPREVWAGLGYVVYVPEPSGATGYGQEFAARHVNDWGRRTAGEVIDATTAFLAAHPFVDPARVGCIGASYGGFLTEYVLTRTDLFACGVSHAGISSIASYWGEGLWGYDYGARALANAFPWADRDLYVEQSPLFHADKITTPLLLLHGAGDTNVPVGESDQLFTALKLLGREVEYVQVLGQDHWILDHDQRIVWNDTILAWFAKHLRGEPQWWDHLYPRP